MENEYLSPINAAAIHDDTDIISHIIREMCGSQKIIVSGWSIEELPSQADPWIEVFHQQAKKRRQGWKIHVSAAIPSAENVLRQVLPILLDEPTCFKVAASLRWLMILNQGRAGLGQIGKFITVYPVDDEQAVRLAINLDHATHGLRGPTILSDCALRRGSLVHYRYGSFSERLISTWEGTLLPIITAPTGELIEDQRALTYLAPAWAQDPFLITGAAEAPVPLPPLLQGRYLPVAPIYQSARGVIYEAVDSKLPSRCVLKRAYRDAMLDRTLRDARDMLRHEAQILGRLETVLPVPKIYDLFEEVDNLWLAMEYVEGTLLDRYMSVLSQKGDSLPIETLTTWALELACMLNQLHQHQIIYRDLKSVNTIVTPDGRLRLIDFGIAYDLMSSEVQFHGGTRGYSSLQQIANEPAAITDDIYSFGALLYLLATGADPAVAPDATALLGRPLQMVNPRVPAALCQLIARCLASHLPDRYASMQDVIAELQTIEDAPVIVHNAKKTLMSEQGRYYRYACELGETLDIVVQTAINKKGPRFVQLKPSQNSKVILHDLANGMSGVLIALAEIVECFDAPVLRSALHDGAYWLLHAERPAGPLLPGLYTGEAGVGTALLRSGQVLRDPALIAAAEDQSRLVASCPYDLPDLIHGTAGRIKYHVWLWNVTMRPCHLEAAMQAGASLLEQIEETEDGEAYWRVPSGHGELSGNVYLGYAHGVAGIADALLDLHQTSGRTEFLSAAQRTGSWLLRRALPVGPDQQGLGWPRMDGGEICAAFWCHGSAGIGHFLLHAAQQEALPHAVDLACRAARAVVEGTRWAGPSRCHGLAGGIELFLDLHELTGAQEWLHAAYTFAQLLEVYMKEQDGIHLWLTEDPYIITPGFLTGFAGIAATLLRLGTIGTLRHSHFPRLF